MKSIAYAEISIRKRPKLRLVTPVYAMVCECSMAKLAVRRARTAGVKPAYRLMYCVLLSVLNVNASAGSDSLILMLE
jgi:hypothetical protein